LRFAAFETKRCVSRNFVFARPYKTDATHPPENIHTRAMSDTPPLGMKSTMAFQFFTGGTFGDCLAPPAKSSTALTPATTAQTPAKSSTAKSSTAQTPAKSSTAQASAKSKGIAKPKGKGIAKGSTCKCSFSPAITHYVQVLEKGPIVDAYFAPNADAFVLARDGLYFGSAGKSKAMTSGGLDSPRSEQHYPLKQIVGGGPRNYYDSMKSLAVNADASVAWLLDANGIVLVNLDAHREARALGARFAGATSISYAREEPFDVLYVTDTAKHEVTGIRYTKGPLNCAGDIFEVMGPADEDDGPSARVGKGCPLASSHVREPIATCFDGCRNLFVFDKDGARVVVPSEQYLSLPSVPKNAATVRSLPAPPPLARLARDGNDMVVFWDHAQGLLRGYCPCQKLHTIALDTPCPPSSSKQVLATHPMGVCLIDPLADGAATVLQYDFSYND